jgi:hypothetical protein
VTLGELRRITEEARVERHDYFARLYGFENAEDLPTDYFENIEEWEMFPSNAYYMIKVFYDHRIFPLLEYGDAAKGRSDRAAHSGIRVGRALPPFPT